MSSAHPSRRPFANLRQLVRRRENTTGKEERCELCSLLLAPHHPHLLDLVNKQLVCSCPACALLFTEQHPRLRRVPSRHLYLTDFQMTDAEWDQLHIPIHLAFFVHDSQTNQETVRYPSPAGVTEALLPLEAWPDLVHRNPILRDRQADVEALLINRVGEQRDHYLVPIDTCYHLVGVIRTHWRGLSGGAEVWGEVLRFFERVKASATPVCGTEKSDG